MPDGTVTPLRPRAPAGDTDTAALNDIHTLLTSTDPGDSTLADIAAILARACRPMVKARDIEASTTETALGWPVACVDAGDTTVFVRQSSAGARLVVEICTKTDAERAALAVTLDGRPLHPGGPTAIPPLPDHQPPAAGPSPARAGACTALPYPVKGPGLP